WRDDGRYELSLPFVQETELVMDILRHGAEVTVLSPPALVKRIREALGSALGLYR
ncbi:MAG: WYL domain-containing protein, partial [Betaproteobacteria bacterium]